MLNCQWVCYKLEMMIMICQWKDKLISFYKSLVSSLQWTSLSPTPKKIWIFLILLFALSSTLLMPAASYFCNGDERQHNSSLSEEKWQVSDFDLQTTRRELSYLFMYESSLEMEKRASKILKKKNFHILSLLKGHWMCQRSLFVFESVAEATMMETGFTDMTCSKVVQYSFWLLFSEYFFLPFNNKQLLL